MRDFELPPKPDTTNQHRKGVSWSATPKENDQAFVEKRKMLICYQIAAHLSIKTVLKETHNMFKEMDKAFLMVSKKDSTVIIKTAKDFDKFSPEELKKAFPAELVSSCLDEHQ